MASNKHIMVVEDDPTARELLEMILKEESFQVTSAATGKEFLTSVIKTNPDMVILDIQLPDLSGYEICEKLRKNTKTKNLPVIMLTSNHLDTEVEAGFDAGADEYIIKPIDSARILSAIESIIAIRKI